MAGRVCLRSNSARKKRLTIFIYITQYEFVKQCRHSSDVRSTDLGYFSRIVKNNKFICNLALAILTICKQKNQFSGLTSSGTLQNRLFDDFQLHLLNDLGIIQRSQHHVLQCSAVRPGYTNIYSISAYTYQFLPPRLLPHFGDFFDRLPCQKVSNTKQHLCVASLRMPEIIYSSIYQEYILIIELCYSKCP